MPSQEGHVSIQPEPAPDRPPASAGRAVLPSSSLPGEMNAAPDPGTLELPRKLAHAAPGLIPFVMWWIPHDDPLPLWNLGVVVAVVGILLLIAFRLPSGLRRHRRENWIRTCLTYGLPPLGTLLIFPARAEYAAVVITVLAFGDSAASIGGRLFGAHRLPWSPDKSWIGLAAFVLVAGPVATLAFWGEAHPAVGWHIAATYGITAACLGGLAETLTCRLDDNVRASLGALAGVLVVAMVLPTAA